MPIKTIRIELRGPAYTVDRQPARYQSLWLLLRMYHADRTASGPVHVPEILARFPGTSSLRMRISRAYADYRAWNVSVGWGQEYGKDPALLNHTGRSRGPFWLAPGQAEQLDIRLDGRPLDLARLADFLGIATPALEHENAISYVMHDVTYWSELTVALRLARDGMAASDGRGAGKHFHKAYDAAKDDFQAALSLLKESLAWRRSGDLGQSANTLARLRPYIRTQDKGTALPSIAAMAGIAHAWNLYAQTSVPAAQGELARMEAEPDLQPVIRYNPRVRFEFLNLRALLSKAIALEPVAVPQGERAQAAQQAIQDFSGALQAAFEADSIEAAQDVAANIGWSLWLFWSDGLVGDKETASRELVQMQSIKWIGLSEWICDRFGVGGGSAWNTVFVLRIARGGCVIRRGAVTLQRFQAHKPVAIRQVVLAAQPHHAPFSAAKGYTDWSSVARFTLEEHDRGHAMYGPSQLANVLLEAAWFSTHEQGLCQQAYEAVERLATLVPTLHPTERAFFRKHLRQLPAELLDGITGLSG